MPIKKFLIIFIPYLVVYIGYIIYEVTIANNVDMKGWWPVVLILGAAFHALTTVIYCLIDKLYPSSYRYTAVYGLLFTLPFIISFLINDIIYPVNWYAVNSGEVELTTVQTVFNSSLFLPVMSGLILLSHFILRWLKRSKSSR